MYVWKLFSPCHGPKKTCGVGGHPTRSGVNNSFASSICLRLQNVIYYSRWTKYSNPAAHTMLNPRAPNSQCFSARGSKSEVEGLISFVHWGECTSGYINIKIWGVRGLYRIEEVIWNSLNISSIYGSIYKKSISIHFCPYMISHSMASAWDAHGCAQVWFTFRFGICGQLYACGNGHLQCHPGSVCNLEDVTFAFWKGTKSTIFLVFAGCWSCVFWVPSFDITRMVVIDSFVVIICRSAFRVGRVSELLFVFCRNMAADAKLWCTILLSS